MTEHVLTMQARAMTSDHETHRRVAEIARRVQAQVEEALAVVDPADAAVCLPLAVRALYAEIGRLHAAGLLPGLVWVYEQHRQLHARAVQLLGADQVAVQRCLIEPMPAGAAAARRPSCRDREGDDDDIEAQGQAEPATAGGTAEVAARLHHREGQGYRGASGLAPT